ncbi:MAG: hypothetical protein HY257_09115 [Chloroflexi bacterium]|nr:hypothetical protein [Chloroflexota bacterium]
MPEPSKVSIQEPPLNVLVLYDHISTYTTTVKEYLESFLLYSKHRIFYAAATSGNHAPPTTVDLSLFDVVIIHYSVRLCYDWHILPVYAKAVARFDGLKMLFIQDEYDHTDLARQWMKKLGINVVFTCVPEQFIEQVYPSALLPKVDFIPVLTGYAPLPNAKFSSHKPFAERKYVIGYRGRRLPFHYGDLAREKSFIGQEMRRICEARGISVNIEWEEIKRIYGDKWYAFLRDCRATLGTEGGSNVFDFNGTLKSDVDNALKKKPDLSYEEIHHHFLAKHEGNVRMNQISPRIFEAIALRTVLVLFEGDYSGVVKPNLHYILLKKDFSNVDQVLEKLLDDCYLEELTECAYRDIIESGNYSYRGFVQMVDAQIDRRVKTAKNSAILTGVVAFRRNIEETWQLVAVQPESPVVSMFTSQPIGQSESPPPGTGRLGGLRYRYQIVVMNLFNYASKLRVEHPRLYVIVRAIYRGMQTVWKIMNRLLMRSK